MTHARKERSLSRQVAVVALTAAAVASCAVSQAPASGSADDLGSSASALAVTTLFPTGVDATGKALATGATDPHYTLTSTDPGFPGPNAVAVDAQGALAPGVQAWTPNTATAKWISLQTSAQSPVVVVPYTYTYTTTFAVAGDPTTATLTGAVACDDSCVMLLNGTQVQQFAAPAWGTPRAFTLAAGSPFKAGQNTLAVRATNSGGIVTGFHLSVPTTPVGGCTLDSQCTSAQFCNTQTSACTPKLPDGTKVPTISGHTPPLVGTCSAAVGSAVCVSGACDTATNACGGAGDGGAPAGCTLDSQCTSAQFCNTQSSTCTPKLPDGTPVPTIPGHNPPLVGTCSVPVGNAVCVTGTCDVAKNTCGAPACKVDGDCASTQFCNTQSSTCTPKLPDGTPIPTIPGHTPPLVGSCSTAVGTVVCVTGACNTTTRTCGTTGGSAACTVDSDCASTQFCNTQTSTCTPKIPDGNPVPTIPGHTPPLVGTCSTEVGAAVCVSAVCSTTTNACGAPGGPACTVDGDCASSQFCNTQTSTCTPKLPDGTPIPTVPGHTPPLIGTCSVPVGSAVCASGACNVANNQCTSGCAVDSDCASTQFCNTESLVCVPKIPNGNPVPTVNGHTPPLTGACTVGAAVATCFAGVCDTADNDCGYANGDGPCTTANGGTVCRSGLCDAAAGTCAPGGACTKDSDCTSAQFCNTQTSTCTAKIPSSVPVPTITGHTPPLTGACIAAVGAAVCVAAVCDTTNNACGYTNGNGPCSLDNGPVVCQSGVCNAGGTCGPGASCGTDADCTDPAAPVCDPSTNVCVARPDAGAGDGGSSSDGGKGPGADAGNGSGGYAAGGGLSCDAGPPGSNQAGAGGLALLGAVMALGAVRRKRRG